MHDLPGAEKEKRQRCRHDIAAGSNRLGSGLTERYGGGSFMKFCSSFRSRLMAPFRPPLIVSLPLRSLLVPSDQRVSSPKCPSPATDCWPQQLFRLSEVSAPLQQRGGFVRSRDSLPACMRLERRQTFSESQTKLRARRNLPRERPHDSRCSFRFRLLCETHCCWSGRRAATRHRLAPGPAAKQGAGRAGRPGLQ